jgi:uncharacterized protein (PEP-CTERM system associated)
MIREMLHPVRAGRFSRPVTLKLAVAAAALAFCTASPAQAQFDKGGYTSVDTPQSRAQRTHLEKLRDSRRGIRGATTPGKAGEGEEDEDTETNIPELQVFAAVNLAEVYTSNAAGSIGRNKGYDFYTKPGIRLSAIEQSAHVTATLDYSLNGQYHARDHDLDQFVHRLRGMANAELINQLLFLDLQAFAKPAALTRTGALTAADDVPNRSNYRDSYGYAVRPTLLHQFGSAVETDLWFSQSGVFFVTPSGAAPTPLPGFFQPPRNSNTSSVGARIASLDDFVRLKWTINASAANTYQSAHNSQRQRSATANLSYAVTNSFSLIGTGGYQTYHSSFALTKDLDGPTLLGGFQFTPSPDFYFYAQAGTQNNFPTYIGSLRWILSPITSVTASATDRVLTPQQQLQNNLQNPSGIGDNGTGAGVPPGSTPPGSIGSDILSPDGLSLDNSIYRYRQFNADLIRNTERMRYQLSAFATLRDRLNDIPANFINKNSKSYGIRANVLRRLRRDLDGTLGVSVSRAHEFNGSDDILQGDVGLNYHANETLSFYLDTSVLARKSKNLVGFNNGNLTDVRVTVGVSKSF